MMLRQTHRRPVKVVTFAVIILVLSLLAGPIGYAQGQIFQPSDQSPVNNPCPPQTVPNDVWQNFKEKLGKALGTDAGIVQDIDSQVKEKVPDADEKPVSVEIFVVTEDEFKKEYADDADGLPGNEGKTQEQLKESAQGLWNGNSAYTYTSDKLNADGVQKLKVKIFCKNSLRTRTLDSSIYELIVHELVHAKLYAMLVLGVQGADLPFQDHDQGFFNEVKRLHDLLKENLKLSYSPNGRFSSDLLATVIVDNSEETLTGNAMVTVGPVGDTDFDGLSDVPTEIVSMHLNGPSIEIDESPTEPSTGITEEEMPGVQFPARSFFDIFYDASVQGQPLTKQSRMEGSINSWPPFGETYVNPRPSPPFDFSTLTFVPFDADSDTLPDHLDPDDDNDRIPDVEDPDPLNPDRDGDGILDSIDNCPDISNPDQRDTDGHGVGDACDADDDGDGFLDQTEVAFGSDPLNPMSIPENNTANLGSCNDGLDNDLDGLIDSRDPGCSTAVVGGSLVPISLRELLAYYVGPALSAIAVATLLTVTYVRRPGRSKEKP